MTTETKATEEKKAIWYKTWWGVLIVIFLILPFFLIWQIWAKTKWGNIAKVIVTLLIIGFYTMFLAAANSDTPAKTADEKTAPTAEVAKTLTAEEQAKKDADDTAAAKKKADDEAATKAAADTKAETDAKAKTTPTATETPTPAATPTPNTTPTPEPVSSETISQKNAVAKAKSYLDYTAFSHDGLVAQLEYEQFSHADSVYGADNSGANWNEQAAKKAKSYMDYSAFSRGSLIAQLEYDKFTQAQAEYGVNAVGL